MKHKQNPHQVKELLLLRDSENDRDRLFAIKALGDIGDAEVLKRLRKHLTPVNQELQALIISIGKL